jgi:ubiquinone/menaquinone biosynthesis C-methylase UbiE
VDIQQGMLDLLKEKAEKEGLLPRIRLHKAEPRLMGLTGKENISVAFAFYVVHEVPDIAHLMREVFTLLVPGGTFLIVEPKFAVSASEFEKTLSITDSVGFHKISSPSVFLSRAILLGKD